MKRWRVDFSLKLIIKTPQEKPNLDSLEKAASEIPGIENLMEFKKSIREMVGADTDS